MSGRLNRVLRNSSDAGRLGLLDLATEIARHGPTFVRIVPRARMARAVTLHAHSAGSTTQRREPDPDRNQRSAKSRSIRTMLEIARSEHLDTLVTLTFALPTDVKAAQRAWRAHVRRVGSEKCRPYIVVPESGRSKSSVHLHVLARSGSAQEVAGRWELGHVDVKCLPLDELKNVTAYLGKQFASASRPAGNRYWASRGSKPAAHTSRLASSQQLSRVLSEYMAGELESLDIVTTNLGTITTLEWETSKGDSNYPEALSSENPGVTFREEKP